MAVLYPEALTAIAAALSAPMAIAWLAGRFFPLPPQKGAI
jgi:hypothetical protein